MVQLLGSITSLHQAVFMAHQGFVLGYRIMEGLLCGRRMNCQKIAEHQEFVEKYDSRFQNMFKIGDNPEIGLIELLDQAYSGIGNGSPFPIDMDQMNCLDRTLEAFIDSIDKVFKKELRFLKAQGANGKMASLEPQNPEGTDLLAKIKN